MALAHAIIFVGQVQVNSSTQVQVNSSTLGYLDTGGTFMTAVYTQAWDINNAGQIVGDFATLQIHGFLETNGIFTTIDFPIPVRETLLP
jgi:hypothetical protein